MRKIDLIVIHCSATREDCVFTERSLDVCHRSRGFDGIGYHFYIRRNGDIKTTRAIEKMGINAKYMDIMMRKIIFNVPRYIEIKKPITISDNQFFYSNTSYKNIVDSIPLK